MKLNIKCKTFFVFVFVIVLGNQPSFGKFLFSPKDSLDKTQSLNGHRFIINNLVGSPFIQTYLENQFGVGQTVNLNTPILIIDSVEVPELQGELVFTTINIEYQQAIRNWMAFRVKVIVTGRLGDEAGALISEGANFVAGYELGWLFKLYQTKKFVLSGSFDLINRNYTVADLQNFIQGVIDSGRIVKSNNFVKTAPTIQAGGSVKFCYAFNQTLGFAGNMNLFFGESIDRTAKSRSYFEYGGAFDADLFPKQKIPIGFLAGFYHNSAVVASEHSKSDPNNILFQINYTGKQDLNLGLGINYQFYQPSDFEEDIKFVYMSMNLRYFF